MKISKTKKLELCVSKDDTRSILQSIYVKQEGEQAFAYATDGSILVKTPVEIEAGELERGNSITGQDLKFNRSNSAVKKQDYVFVCLGPLDGQYPNTDVVFPKAMPLFKIGIRASNIEKIAKALGQDDLVFEFTDAEKVIKIRPLAGDDESIALCMPLAIK